MDGGIYPKCPTCKKPRNPFAKKEVPHLDYGIFNDAKYPAISKLVEQTSKSPLFSRALAVAVVGSCIGVFAAQTGYIILGDRPPSRVAIQQAEVSGVDHIKPSDLHRKQGT